jgi:hypothetical protein
MKVREHCSSGSTREAFFLRSFDAGLLHSFCIPHLASSVTSSVGSVIHCV